MSVPSAVAKAEAEADRLQQELIEKRNAPPSDAPAPQPPEATAAPAPAPTPAPSPAPQVNEETWEHRFKVLKGKYDAEVPRLSTANRDLGDRLANLETEIAELRKPKPESLVKPEEVEQYGEGLLDVARRIAQEELATQQATIDSLTEQIKQLSAGRATDSKAVFLKNLTDLVPEWQQLNTDESFLDWLDGVDELAGLSRQELLSRAQADGDAGRASKFFTAFKKTRSAGAATAEAALASQVAPPAGSSAPTPPAKKLWTRPEIADFYSRLRRGEVSDADAVAIDADIQAASIEGRIR